MAEYDLSEDERDALAAELALGVLDGELRGLALRLTLADPDFAQAVSRWEERLAPLYLAYASAEPSDDVWPRIAAQLENAPEETVVDINDTGMARWRAAAITAATIAASLALILIMRPAPSLPVAQPLPSPSDAIIAQLVGTQQDMKLVARFDPAQGTLKVRTAGLTDPRLAPELWIIPADGKPRSLGLIDPAGDRTLTISKTLRPLFADGATLAVTMEPVTGAPHAAPSSTPVIAGAAAKI